MALNSGTNVSGKLNFSLADISYLLRMVRVGDIRDSSGINNASNEANLTNQPTTNGSSSSEFIRLAGLYNYDNGYSSPNRVGSNGAALPNERVISNTVGVSNPGNLDMPQVGGWNNLLMSVGQYIDHGLDFIRKGGNGTYVVADVPNDGPVGALSSTRATPAPGTGTDLSNPITYRNITTPWVDQNQTYGSDPAITNLLRATLRDANGNVVRDANGNLVKTAYMLDSAVHSPDGTADNPRYYDVLVNNGVSKATLDGILNRAEVQLAHAHYTQAYSNFQSQGPSAFAVITAADKAAMAQAKADLMALNGWVDNAWATANANGALLLGDANPQSQDLNMGPGNSVPGDVINLLQHYIAGDIRPNENVGLTSLHTVFKNSHNVIADQISAAINAANSDIDPNNNVTGVTSEEIFQMSRIVMASQYQRMVFDQFLVAMTGGVATGVAGPGLLPPGNAVLIQEHGFIGWMPEVNASISEEFATAAFRVGHSQIYANLGSLNPATVPSVSSNANVDGKLTSGGFPTGAVLENTAEVISTSLVDLFLNPAGVNALGGAGAILAGQTRESAQQVDTILTDAVRNLLVGQPLDLGALNIARAREMGTPGLNEFRKGIYNYYLSTGVASSLGSGASDMSAAIFDPLSPTPTQNLILETLRPYKNWADLGHNLRDWVASVDENGNALAFDLNDSATWGDSILRDQLMALYGAPVGSTPTLNANGGVDTNGSSPYGDGADRANLANDWGLDNVDLWVGGLAEKSVLTPTGEGLLPSLMGSTFTFIIQEQFDRLQDADRHYYKIDLAGTDLLQQIAANTFTDMLRQSLGSAAQYVHANTFQTFNLADLAEDVGEWHGDTDPNLVDDLIIGNAMDNILTGGLGSDDIRGGAGNDVIEGGDGIDYLKGQGGDDTLSAGQDIFVDFIWGGDGNDFITAEQVLNADAAPGGLVPAGDMMMGENGNDLILGSVLADIIDGGMDADILIGDRGADIITGDSGSVGVGDDGQMHNYGNDVIDGGLDADIITGGGGDDFIKGGTGDDIIHGDWAATSNAEILARALRDPNTGAIIGTVVPLNFDIGGVVVVDEINPITGVKFTAAQLAEFEAYIESLRVNPNGAPGGLNARGPQVLMKVMPYVGPEGDDLIEGDDTATDFARVGGIDTIFADGGNDTIRPGDLSDTIFGGRGFDILDYDLADPVLALQQQLAAAQIALDAANAAIEAAGGPNDALPADLAAAAAAEATIADITAQLDALGNPAPVAPEDFEIVIEASLAAAAGNDAAQRQVDGRVVNLTALAANPVAVVEVEAGVPIIVPPGDTDTFFGMESVVLKSVANGGGSNDVIRRDEANGAVNSVIELNADGSGRFDGLNFSGVETAQLGAGSDTIVLSDVVDDILDLSAGNAAAQVADFTYGSTPIHVTGAERLDLGQGYDTAILAAGATASTGANGEISLDGVTIAGLEEVQGTGLNVVATNTADQTVIFTPAADNLSGLPTVEINGITFVGVSSTDAGAGQDRIILSSLDDAVDLVNANSFIYGGVTFTNIETINAIAGLDSVTDATGANSTFNLQPTAADSPVNAFRTGTMTFTEVETLNAGDGTDTLVGTDAGDVFLAAGVVFDPIEVATVVNPLVAGTVEVVNPLLLSGTLVVPPVPAGLTVNGIEAVEAGGGTDYLYLTDVADTLQMSAAAKVNFNGITYSGIDVVDADLMPPNPLEVDSLIGLATTDVFNLGSIPNSVSSQGIRYDNFEAVDAAGGTDVLNGSANNDAFSLNGTLQRSVSVTFNGAVLPSLTFTNLESVNGGAGTDSLTLSAASDNLTLQTVTSFTFNGVNFSSIEVINAGAGTDTLNGTAAANTFSLTGLNGEVNGGTILYKGLEALNAGAGTDKLVATAANETFTVTGAAAFRVAGIAFSATEQVDGGAGTDLVTLTSAADTITLTAATATSTGSMSISGITFSNVEGLVGGGGNDRLTGNAGANVLNGAGAGSTGSGQIDTLTGAAGADTFVLGEAGVVYYQGGALTDYVRITDFGNGADTIQLVGNASMYELIQNTTVAGNRGVGLYRNNNGVQGVVGAGDDLVALIQGTTSALSTQATLTSSMFRYVG